MDTREHKMSEIKVDIFGGSDNDSRSEQDLVDHRSASIESQYKDETYGTIQLKNENFDTVDLSPIEVRAENIKSEGDIDIHYENVKTEIDDKKPGEYRLCEVCNNDVVNDSSFFIKFPRDCSCQQQNAINFSSVQDRNLTQDVKPSFLCRASLKASESNHVVKKPFECKSCSKAFAKLGHLKDHERIHTGERPFHCKICSKAFAQSQYLKYHERIHTGEKPFDCANCSKAFTRPSHLKEHERIHTGQKQYVCKYCSKAFLTSYHWKRHERIHTGEKIFHCKICHKAFTQSNNLKRHEKFHI